MRKKRMIENQPDSENKVPGKSLFLFYTTEDGNKRIDVRLEDETVWLSQKLLAELFQVGVNTINHHIKSIYGDGELLPETTIRKYRILQKGEQKQTLKRLSEGKKKPE